MVLVQTLDEFLIQFVGIEACRLGEDFILMFKLTVEQNATADSTGSVS